MRNFWVHVGSLIILVGFFSSCKTVIPENRHIIQSVKIEGNKQLSSEILSPLISIHPNRKLLGIPIYLYLYSFGNLFYSKSKFEKKLANTKASLVSQLKNPFLDSLNRSKIQQKYTRKIQDIEDKIQNGNYFMQHFGEAPVLYDSLTAIDVQSKIQFFYRENGFRKATVEIKTRPVSFQKMGLLYQIQEGNPLIINSIGIMITNAQVREIIASNHETFLKVGTRYSTQIFDLERQKLENLLQNNGYFSFKRSAIKFFINDTLYQDKAVVQIQIDSVGSNYKPYFIRKSIVSGISGTDIGLIKEDSLVNQRVSFLNSFQVGKGTRQALRRLIITPKNALYRLSEINTIQKNLVLLDYFKIVNNRFDTTRSTSIMYWYLAPLPKYQFLVESGPNLTGNVAGWFINSSLKIRNVFGKFESLDIGIRTSLEGQASITQGGQFFRGLEAILSGSLQFPRIIIGNDLFKNKINPRTIFITSYGLSNRMDFERRNLRISQKFVWNTSDTKQFEASVLDISFLRTQNTTVAFDEYIQNLRAQGANSLVNSFENYFVSNSRFSYTNNRNPLFKNQQSSYFRIEVESGGTLLNFIPKEQLASTFGAQGWSQYGRISTEFRWYRPRNNSSLWVFRFQMGIAIPYRGTFLPYEKYFFSGGQNSLRAWRPRRLGLGGFYYLGSTQSEIDINTPIIKDNTQPLDYKYESLGEMLLESNIEYRFKLFHFGGDVNGAFFADAGNIWNLYRTDISMDLEKDELKSFKISNFYRQIALGIGFGIRYDYSFIVLRLDAGIKVIEPARIEGKRFVLPNFSLKSDSANPIIFNIAIGYPF